MDPRELREQTVKDAKCDLILKAAHRIFSEKGYLNARIEDIAAAAGFSKPSLYSYYQDKEAIFLSLAIREMEAVQKKIGEAISLGGSFQRTLETILKIVFENFSQTNAYFNAVTNFRALNAVQAEISKHDTLMGRFHDMVGQSMGTMQAFIERAEKNGEISATLETVDVAWLVMSLMQGVQMRAWMTRKPIEVDSTVKKTISFIMNGIAKKDSKTGGVRT
jgi:AcrR family transcriptional regulator